MARKLVRQRTQWQSTLCIVVLLSLSSCFNASECEHMLGCIACTESPPQPQQPTQQPGTQPSHIEHRGNAIRAGSRLQGVPSASGLKSSPTLGAAGPEGGEQMLSRQSRGLQSVLDGSIAKLFGFKNKQKQTNKPSTPKPMQAAAADSTFGSSSSSRSMVSSQQGQHVSTSNTGGYQSQPGGTAYTNSVPRVAQQQHLTAAPAAQQPVAWLNPAGDAAAAAYVHSWQPAQTPGVAAAEASLRPPAQAFTQAPQQPLSVLTTDPKDHTAPHPWDVILFKTNQFNTSRPAYRLGGLGLMLMTDFNDTKPLTDWHVLASDPHAQQQHSMQQGFGGNRPAASSVSTASNSFVAGHSLVKPGLGNMQQPARPVAAVHHAAGGAASVQMLPQHVGPHTQQQQQQQQQQQRHVASVGVASVSSVSSSSSQVAGVQAPAAASGSGSVSGGLKATLAKFKPESMVAQLRAALQRNMRMSAPGHTPTQEPGSAADSSSSMGSSSSSGSSVLLSGGIQEVTMEPTQLWCIACKEPAYLLSPLGYCVCGPGHGRLMDTANPLACMKCPQGHISAMNNTAGQRHKGQQQPVAVQTCKPCPEGQLTNEAQTACVIA